MKIIKKNTEAKWFKFEGKVEFLIKPFRFSIMKLDDVSQGMLQQFKYCIVEWKGLVGEDDKPFKCDDENKEYIYDYYTDVREFVFEKQNELKDRIDKQLKN